MIVSPWDALILAVLCLIVGYMAGTVHAEWDEHQREMARIDADLAAGRRRGQTWLPSQPGWMVSDPEAVERILREIEMLEAEVARGRERPTA